MSNGDQNNALARLWANTAPWFSSPAPVANAILTGMASIFATAYTSFMLAKANMRIPTTVGAMLDLTAYDFFGNNFKRLKGQSDAVFAPIIVKEILRERVTRKGIEKAISDATGSYTRMFEPFVITDTGAYGYAGYYGYTGRYGNSTWKGRGLIDVQLPVTRGTIVANGYGGPFSGYGQGFGCYINNAEQIGPIDQAALSRIILNTKAAGIVAWARFVDASAFEAPVMLADDNGNILVSDSGQVIVLSMQLPSED